MTGWFQKPWGSASRERYNLTSSLHRPPSDSFWKLLVSQCHTGAASSLVSTLPSGTLLYVATSSFLRPDCTWPKE